MIYATPFRVSDKKTTGPSVDSGFTSLDQVVQFMGGDFVSQSQRVIIYGGESDSSIAYSDFVFCVDEGGNKG